MGVGRWGDWRRGAYEGAAVAVKGFAGDGEGFAFYGGISGLDRIGGFGATPDFGASFLGRWRGLGGGGQPDGL